MRQIAGALGGVALERALLSSPPMRPLDTPPSTPPDVRREVKVCPVALRQELALYQEPADVNSSTFIRFVIRLSERLDVDIPREHYEQLATINGAFEYIRRIG